MTSLCQKTWGKVNSIVNIDYFQFLQNLLGNLGSISFGTPESNFGIESGITPRLKSNTLKVLHLQLSSFHAREKFFEAVTQTRFIFITTVKLCDTNRDYFNQFHNHRQQNGLKQSKSKFKSACLDL